MSKDHFHVSVPSYEEQQDDTGAYITLYHVKVELDRNIKYSLLKRYSSFEKLFTTLLDRVPELTHFKFPNKSMFNTHAQFTKERRRNGFDELLQTLVKHSPILPELAEFLEIEVQKANALKRKKLEQKTTKEHPHSDFSTDSSHQPKHLSPDPQLIHHVHRLKTVPLSPFIDDSSLHLRLARSLPALLLSSFLVAGGFYLLLVLVGVVDVSQTTPGRVVLTALSLGSLLSLLRLARRRRDWRESVLLAGGEGEDGKNKDQAVDNNNAGTEKKPADT